MENAQQIRIRRMTEKDAGLGAFVEKNCFSEPWSEEVYHAVLLLPYANYYAAFSDSEESDKSPAGIPTAADAEVPAGIAAAADAEAPAESIIGTVGLQVIGGDGEISNVAVMPEFRGRGIARRLLETAIAKAREQGVKDFTLEVRASNHAAIHLYESLGFRQEGLRKRFYTCPDEDALILWLRGE